jgi:CcmD family protein
MLVLTLGLTGPLLVARLGAQGEETFEPIRPGEIITEQLPATPLVFAAYAVVWVALLIYMFTLWRRIGRVERELSDVHRRLDAK